MLNKLIRTTLFNPMQAAEQIVSFGIKREVLWMALALAAVLNALVFSLAFQAAPPVPTEGLAPQEAEYAEFMMRFLGSPAFVSVAVVLSLVVSVFTFHWAALILKGQGQLTDVLAIVTWWQFLVLASGIALIIVSLLAPLLASYMSLIVNIWEFFILSGLISGVHRFAHPLKGLAAIVLSLMIMVIAVMFLLTLIALFGPIGAPNV